MTLSLKSCSLVLPETNLAALRKGAIELIENIDQLLHYPNSRGDENLRNDIKRITPNWHGEVLITGSATKALASTLEEVVGEGKTIALKVPAYFTLIQQAKKLKQTILPWETMEDLERLKNFDAVIVTSNHTPPASLSLTKDEKKKIADLARKNKAWVIEDNVYEPLWFEKPGEPIPADADRSLRIGSFSKTSAPGLRLGFIRANDEILDLIRKPKIIGELSTTLPAQLMVRASLRDENLGNWRKTLHKRADLLRINLEDRTEIQIPEPDGGSYLRLDLPKDCDPHTLAKATEEQGLQIDTNEKQYTDGIVRPHLRLHCGAIDEKDIPQAAEILARAIKK